jgi:selenocysteine lyase/cysteine desulfurase
MARSAELIAEWPLLSLVGADLEVPVSDGRSMRHVNLDNAATTAPLRSVTGEVVSALRTYGSVHRGGGYTSRLTSEAYESARADLSSFVEARNDDVVIFTRNTTDSLNLLATCVPGETVHLEIEHHANFLPWRARDSRVVRAKDGLDATIAALDTELSRRPAALLTVTGASNVTGECLPIAELASLARRRGARICVDAAQLAPHRRVSLSATGVDYIAFSGHKLYAPFGTGALVGRRDWLDAAPPYLTGGGAVRRVTMGHTEWAAAPKRHEAGTPNVIGVVAMAAACRELGAILDDDAVAHEAALLALLVDGLADFDRITILRLWPGETELIGVVCFAVDGMSAESLAQRLSEEYGISVRDGRFCAHPLVQRLTHPHDRTAVRVSVGLGNTRSDIARLLSALKVLLGTG